MTKADSPNTTSPSRRTVLAGLSVATASVAAVDILLAARVPGDDPIFAAIRREREARTVYDAARAIERRLEDAFPKDAIRYDAAAHLDVGFYKEKELVCWSHEDVDKAFGMMGVERNILQVDQKSAEFKAFKADWQKAHADLDETLAQRERGRAWSAEHPVDEAEEAVAAALTAWWEAQEELLQTQPTSLAGLLAFLDHIDQQEDKDSFIDEWSELAFPTVAASIRSLVA